MKFTIVSTLEELNRIHGIRSKLESLKDAAFNSVLDAVGYDPNKISELSLPGIMKKKIKAAPIKGNIEILKALIQSKDYVKINDLKDDLPSNELPFVFMYYPVARKKDKIEGAFLNAKFFDKQGIIYRSYKDKKIGIFLHNPKKYPQATEPDVCPPYYDNNYSQPVAKRLGIDLDSVMSKEELPKFIRFLMLRDIDIPPALSEQESVKQALATIKMEDQASQQASAKIEDYPTDEISLKLNLLLSPAAENNLASRSDRLDTSKERRERDQVKPKTHGQLKR